jgi:hypothetical protein
MKTDDNDNENKSKTRIEGMILEDLLKLVADGQVHTSQNENNLDKLEDFEVKVTQGNTKEIVKIIQTFIIESSQYILSFYYIEITVDALLQAYFESTEHGLVTCIDQCLRSLAEELQTKSPSTLPQFLENSYFFFKKHTLLANQATIEKANNFLKNYEVIYINLSQKKSKRLF